jgi:hypothetical protein
MTNYTFITINGKDVMTPVSTAHELGCSLPTIGRLVRAKRLTPIKLQGRCYFDRAEVAALAGSKK